jgi:hypothetical protein
MFAFESDMSSHCLEESPEHVARRFHVDVGPCHAERHQSFLQFLGKTRILEMLLAETRERLAQAVIGDAGLEGGEENVVLIVVNLFYERSQCLGSIEALLPVDVCRQGIGDRFEFFAELQHLLVRLTPPVCYRPVSGAGGRRTLKDLFTHGLGPLVQIIILPFSCQPQPPALIWIKAGSRFS